MTEFEEEGTVRVGMRLKNMKRASHHKTAQTHIEYYSEHDLYFQ